MAVFYCAKKDAGCADCQSFQLVSEAALYVDCMLYIKWYEEGDDTTFNFDTMRKFEAHHRAELDERGITKELPDSIESVRSEIFDRVTKKYNSIKTKAEVLPA